MHAFQIRPQQSIVCIESKEFERTKDLRQYVGNWIQEVDYKTWIEGGLIDEAFAKKLKARAVALQPKVPVST